MTRRQQAPERLQLLPGMACVAAKGSWCVTCGCVWQVHSRLAALYPEFDIMHMPSEAIQMQPGTVPSAEAQAPAHSGKQATSTAAEAPSAGRDAADGTTACRHSPVQGHPDISSACEVCTALCCHASLQNQGPQPGLVLLLLRLCLLMSRKQTVAHKRTRQSSSCAGAATQQRCLPGS